MDRNAEGSEESGQKNEIFNLVKHLITSSECSASGVNSKKRCASDDSDTESTHPDKRLYPDPKIIACLSNEKYYSKQVFREEIGDLLKAPKDFSLCYCVAEEFAMTSGLGVQLKNKFGQIDKLMEQRQEPGGVAYLKDGERFIYYLVTQQRSYRDIPMEYLKLSLEKMRQHMLLNNTKKLAMPLLDIIVWNGVAQLINDIFQNDNFEIVLYKLDKYLASLPAKQASSVRFRYPNEPLISLGESFVLLTASIEGEVTPDMELINNTVKFIPQYKSSSNRIVGDYFFIHIHSVRIAVLYVKEKQEDPFSFIAFVKALQSILKDHPGTNDIGMVMPNDNKHDNIFMEKLKTLFKFYCNDLWVNICEDVSSNKTRWEYLDGDFFMLKRRKNYKRKDIA